MSDVPSHVQRWFGDEPVNDALASSGLNAQEFIERHIEGFRAAAEARDYKTMGSLGQAIEKFIEKRARLNGVIREERQTISATDKHGRHLEATRSVAHLIGIRPDFGGIHLDDTRDAEIALPQGPSHNQDHQEDDGRPR